MSFKLRTILAALASAASILLTFLPVQPASATIDWVAAPTWNNLHVKSEDGVFERARREFDNSSRYLVDSETQHNIAWIRTDRNSVTVRYQGGIANANHKVQFVLNGDVAFNSSVGGDVAANTNLSPIVNTDADGVAELTLTLTDTPVAETDLRVGLSSGDAGSEATVGNLVLDWEDPGFFPIIKLVGSGQGFTANCVYRGENAQHQVQHAHECNNGDFQEFTWAWSVFKKDWLPEYSQVYVKSYKYGSTINLVYRITDIWGTLQVDRDVHLNVDAGCRLCRWKNFETDKSTDQNGLVSYSVPNKNTLKDVKNNRFVNSDTKAHEGGFIAFSIQPTTNALDESADFIWPQLVTDINMKASASTLTTLSRGGESVNQFGDFVSNVDGVQVTNPPLSLDTTDSSVNDLDVVNLSVTYMKNSLPIALYSPDIKVTADNGGKAAIADTLRPVSGLNAESSFSSNLTFSYTYPQKIALMCTKTGTTTFKIYTGSIFKTHVMTCKNALSDAKNIEALPVSPAVPATPDQTSFKVTDRWGNPVAGASVHFSTNGNGLIAFTSDVTTGADGIATAALGATESGDQTVTATIQDPDNVTQIGQGVASASAVIHWGTPVITATPSAKQVVFGFYNLAGTKATIQEKKTRSSVNILTANQGVLKKVTKGTHTYKITAGSTVRTITVVVP